MVVEKSHPLTNGEGIKEIYYCDDGKKSWNEESGPANPTFASHVVNCNPCKDALSEEQFNNLIYKKH